MEHKLLPNNNIRLMVMTFGLDAGTYIVGRRRHRSLNHWGYISLIRNITRSSHPAKVPTLHTHNGIYSLLLLLLLCCNTLTWHGFLLPIVSFKPPSLPACLPAFSSSLQTTRFIPFSSKISEDMYFNILKEERGTNLFPTWTA